MPLQRSESKSSFASAASSLAAATAKTTYGILLPVSTCEVSMMDSMPKTIARTWRVSRIVLMLTMLSWLTYEAASLSMTQHHNEKAIKDKMEFAQKPHIIVKRASELDPIVLDYAEEPLNVSNNDWNADDLGTEDKNYTFTDTTTASSPRHATVSTVFQVTVPTIEVTTTETAEVKKQAEVALKAATFENPIISVGIDASSLWFQLYFGGVYDHSGCKNGIDDLDHGVAVVGYGTASNGKDYWIVRNSWGEQWGMNGYILMSRDKDNQCGVACDASFPLMGKN